MMVARGNALVALLLSGAVAAGPPSPATVTRAFGHWLQKRYAGAKGYWTCPAGQVFGRDADCWAEVRVGRRRHLVTVTATLSGGQVVFSRAHDHAAGAYGKWKDGRRSFRVNSHDGDGTGLSKFFVFSCAARDDLVTCRNAFGDARGTDLEPDHAADPVPRLRWCSTFSRWNTRKQVFH